MNVGETDQVFYQAVAAGKGVAQEEMAARIGVHPNTYRKMESDPMRIRLITLLKICEVLKVNSSDIIVDTEKEK